MLTQDLRSEFSPWRCENSERRWPQSSLAMGTEFQTRARVSGITIDGESSRDLDDAISVSAQADGILCQVHITDVDAWVPKGSTVDCQAAQRLETVYRSQYNLPMLPRSLSEQQCSLLPGGERKTLSVSWTLARDGSLGDGSKKGEFG